MPSIFSAPIDTTQQNQTATGGSIFSQPLTVTPDLKTTTQPIQPISTNSKVQSTLDKLISGGESIVKNIGGTILKFITPTAPQVAPSLPEQVFKENPAINPKKPVTVEKPMVNPLPNTTEAVKQLISDPLSLKSDPTKAIGDVINSLKEPLVQEKQKIKDLFSAKTPSQKVGKGLEAVSGVANIIFSPLSALFSGASDLKGRGSLSKLITIPFLAAGEAGTTLSNKTIDILPIPNQVKTDIKTGVGEIVALASQLALGKIAEVGLSKKAELVKKFGEKDANVIIEKATELAKEKAITTANKTSPAITKILENLKEGEQTPQDIIDTVIKSGLEKTTEGKALLQSAVEAGGKNMNIEVTKPKNYTPLVSPTAEKLSRGEVAKEPTEALKPVPQEKVKEVVSKPAVRGQTPSKIAKSIEQKAVEQGLTKGFEGVAGYDKITIKEQAKLATDLLNSDLEKTRRVIRGEEELPKGLKGTALITAMEEHIKNTKNGDLAYELANSPLVSGTSAAAQELRLAAERTPDSLTKQLMDLKQAREEAIKKKYGSVERATENVKKSIRKEVKVPDRYDWGKFINSISC